MKYNRKLTKYINSQNSSPHHDFDYSHYVFSSKAYSKAQHYFSGVISNARCLDVGGGDGTLATLFRKHNNNNITIIDISDAAIDLARNRGFEAIKVDLANEKYPFENETFDCIFCIEVIEHLKNPDHCLNEIQRLLKKNGVLIISTPNNLKGITDKHHVNAWNFTNFSDHLETFGFKKIKEGGYWYMKGTGLFRIPPKILFYLGTKFPSYAKNWIVKLQKN